MQVFLESLKVVPEWLVQQIYLYSNTALAVLSAFVSVSYTHLTLPTKA